MYLLKNITKNFTFNNITNYSIDEQPNLIANKQFANGKRKKVVTSYIDTIITISLKGLKGDVAKTYLDNLVDEDAYEYWSVRDNSYSTSYFIITLPELPLLYCLSDESLVNEFTITLEKSDDYTSSI